MAQKKQNSAEVKYTGTGYVPEFVHNIGGSSDMEYLTNFPAYGPFADFVRNHATDIHVDDITIGNWPSYFNGLLNVMKDGIETDFVHQAFINVWFGQDMIQLSVADMFFNLMMWYLIISAGDKIQPRHIFFEDCITKNSIKNYVDDNFIDPHRKDFINNTMNLIIDGTMAHWRSIDDFSFYLANTINLEDTLKLMKKSPEFYNLMHEDFSNVPIADVKDYGLKLNNRGIEIMKKSKNLLGGYDHCLADAFRAGEGIKARQYKEFAINIGPKPDGRGGVFPVSVNHSFINGGVADPTSYFIDSSVGRTAQIMAKMNVGSSGHLARLMGLNNMNSFLHTNPNYECDTQNMIHVNINDNKMLRMFNNRYYKLVPNGPDYLLKSKRDNHLIGKTIYLHSPITCSSASRGNGVCYKCYGDLAYTTRIVNIGRIASETLTSILTQMLLSAKHMLETYVEKLVWSPKFNDLFEIEANLIKVSSDIDYKDYVLLIDPDSIDMENEDDFSGGGDDDNSVNTYNEYITEFWVKQLSTGEIWKITTEKAEKLFIDIDLNNAIRKHGRPIDGKVLIHFNDIKDSVLFNVMIQNNELSRTLKHVKNLLDSNAILKDMSASELLQQLCETVIKGNINIAAVHLEILIMNQIRSVDDVLEKPEWQYPNMAYRILTLSKSLSENPSVTVSLSFQKLSKMLYTPLTFRKHGASFMDLFFMEKPQVFLASNGTDTKDPIESRNADGLIEPIVFEAGYGPHKSDRTTREDYPEDEMDEDEKPIVNESSKEESDDDESDSEDDSL